MAIAQRTHDTVLSKFADRLLLKFKARFMLELQKHSVPAISHVQRRAISHERSLPMRIEGALTTTFLAVISIIGVCSPAAAMTLENLKGTIWLADSTHHRATVDANGNVAVKEGKEIYVQFLDVVDEVLIAKIQWWNVSANINVVEYAVFSQVDEDMFTYTEAAHAADSDFPGIEGSGTFEIDDESGIPVAHLTQLGHLLDGSASGFSTQLKKVDKVPDIPVSQTYPPLQ